MGASPTRAARSRTPSRSRSSSAGRCVGAVAVRNGRSARRRRRVTYVLRAGSPRLDVEIELDWHHHEHLLSMAFPLDVRADTATCGIQFGAVQPADARVDVVGRGQVRGLRPPLRRRRRAGVRRRRAERRPLRPRLFDGARAGSAWSRGRPLPRPRRRPGPPRRDAQRCSRTGRASPTWSPRPSASTSRCGWSPAARRPVAPAPVGDGHRRAASRSTPSRSPTTAPATSIVRLHEAVRRPGHGSRSRADGRITAACRCNLLEEPTARFEVSDGIVAATLRPFELLTLRLSR